MKWWKFKKRSKAWINWRTKVYKRDGYKCVLCGRMPKLLNPHHIIPWKKAKKYKYYICNGVTLCRGCHRKMYRKELEWVEIIVNKLFKGMDKWKLIAVYATLKKQKKKIGYRKLSIPSIKDIARQ